MRKTASASVKPLNIAKKKNNYAFNEKQITNGN